VSRPSLRWFVTPKGAVAELRDPHGPPTGRQLLKLNALGMLDVGQPYQFEPLTKGEAAWQIDYASRRTGESRERDEDVA
jgi:hypothetical protein